MTTPEVEDNTKKEFLSSFPNPIRLSELGGKKVRIIGQASKAKNAGPFVGIVVAVDPISNSVVLIETENSSETTGKIISLIPRLENDDYSVKILEVSEETKKVYDEFRAEVERKSEGEKVENENNFSLESVEKILKDHRLNYEISKEDYSICVEAGIATIRKPYGTKDIASTNQIVLERLRNLLK